MQELDALALTTDWLRINRKCKVSVWSAGSVCGKEDESTLEGSTALKFLRHSEEVKSQILQQALLTYL